ncbi:MAG TPA: thioesterase family protein [Dongiaceae bacterium]|jgi:acyl-CoA thioesterase FadM
MAELPITMTGAGASDAEPLDLYRVSVKPEWIDYNGHMHEAYYVLVFGFTTDAFLDLIGMNAGYRERTHTSLYTIEGHIAFLQEVPLGTSLRVTTTLVASDAKRVHLFHQMIRESDGAMLATYELLALHVDQRGPKVSAMPAPILDKVSAIAAAHSSLAGALPTSGTSRILLNLKSR